jgi:predicted metal-dependent RNase
MQAAPHIVGAGAGPTSIPIDENDVMKITPIGSGNEVGRSAVLVEFKGKTVLVRVL